MKKKLWIVIGMMQMCALSACGAPQAETTATDVVSVTEQESTADEISMTEELATTEQIESTDENTEQGQKREASYAELQNILDEINTDVYPGTAGSSLVSVRVAAHVLNWGVGTSMTTEEIRQVTAEWLKAKDSTEQEGFKEKMEDVYAAYQELLGSDAENLLEEAGVEDAAYPWSDSPVETVEAVMEAVQENL